MLNKLAVRNARRSMGDYLIYLVTMAIIAALMLAFDSMIFSENLRKLYAEGGTVMGAMLGLATFFILFIIAWLTHYMIRFMLEKRSREFGTYMLVGFKKKEIGRLFTRENTLLGAVAFVLGIVPGLFFQQLLTAVFYSIFGQEYHISVEVSGYGFLMTFCLFSFVYFFAMLRNRKRFKKMNIHDLIYLDRQNEKLQKKQGVFSAFWFFLSLAYMAVFFIFLFTGSFTMVNVWPMCLALIIAIYLFYIGISGALNLYLKQKGRKIYRGSNLFLLRQMSSKIKTMRFTMGTLTVLFDIALVGCSAAMMLGDYQKKMLEAEVPFDVIMFSDQKEDSFQQQLGILEKEAQINSTRVYRVYENGSTTVNDYLYDHLAYFDYETDLEKRKASGGSNEYFDYDTYMKLSDYNALRHMLGKESVSLKAGEYLIQTKERLQSVFAEFAKKQQLEADGRVLSCKGISTISFAQSGENGADYILVIPDQLADEMEPFYSLLAADLKGKAPDNLQAKLADTQQYENADTGDLETKITWGYGTNQVITMAATVLVKDNVTGEMRFILTAMSYPLFYVGIVFLCVAMTILSVQQLSDSAKYKFRYRVLSKLGLREGEINKVVLKQLAFYYLCPMLTAALISGVISIFASERFIFYTGIKTPVLFYYGMSLLAFAAVYLLYFAATYAGFKKNIYSAE